MLCKKALGTSPYSQFIYQTIVKISTKDEAVNISEIVRILGVNKKWQAIIGSSEKNNLQATEKIVFDIIKLIFDEMSQFGISAPKNNLDFKVMQISTDLK